MLYAFMLTDNQLNFPVLPCCVKCCFPFFYKNLHVKMEVFILFTLNILVME